MPHVDDVAALREEAHDVRHFDGLSLDNPSSVDELPHRLEVARRYSWTSRSLGMTSVVRHGELAPAEVDVLTPQFGDARPSYAAVPRRATERVRRLDVRSVTALLLASMSGAERVQVVQALTAVAWRCWR